MMSDAQLNRMFEKLDLVLEEVGEVKQLTKVQAALFQASEKRVDKIETRQDTMRDDVTTLKTKASVFGTLGGIISGSVMGFFASLINGN